MMRPLMYANDAPVNVCDNSRALMYVIITHIDVCDYQIHFLFHLKHTD
jgi:hypothetical protein